MKKREEIILFGASAFGETVYDVMKLLDAYHVIAFADNDKKKQGSEFCGLPVISAEEAVSKGARIIIASMYVNEISRQLNELEFSNYQDNIQYLLYNLDKIEFRSSDYWEKRYGDGGNSGAGSYGRLAQFKADVINEFIQANHVTTVIEMGCGDGNQLSLMKYPKYIGFDVSKTAIKMCLERFKNDLDKDFIFYDAKTLTSRSGILKSDLAVSLDVIFHLVEDTVYENYMRNLFNFSKQYVIIYSSNFEGKRTLHECHRKFTNWVDEHRKDFMLKNHILNQYPLINDPQNESLSDFFIYEKIT